MEIPKEIIGKDVRIVFSGGGYQIIHKVREIKENIITDENGNYFSINLNIVASFFIPKSEKYHIGNDIEKFDDVGEIFTEKFGKKIGFSAKNS